MTVTSGFYVRSLCHDLGEAVGSLGLMSSLVRSRQGDFELGKNVLEYEDLTRGEEVWEPKVKAMLEEWQEKEGILGESAEGDSKSDRNSGGDKRHTQHKKAKVHPRRERERERRNSSSVER